MSYILCFFPPFCTFPYQKFFMQKGFHTQRNHCMLLELYVYVQQNRRDIQECWGKKTRIKGMHASIFFSLSYTFFISRAFVYRGGFLYELIDVQRVIGVTVFTISFWNVMRIMRKNREKMRKTETRARSRAYMLFHFHYIILTIWDLIQRLQLARNCDVKFCLY